MIVCVAIVATILTKPVPPGSGKGFNRADEALERPTEEWKGQRRKWSVKRRLAGDFHLANACKNQRRCNERYYAKWISPRARGHNQDDVDDDGGTWRFIDTWLLKTTRINIEKHLFCFFFSTSLSLFFFSFGPEDWKSQ